MSIRRIITSLYLASFCAVSLGCSGRSVPPQTPPPPPNYVYHTVQYPGETLASIAKWYTGSSSNWQVIRDANPELNPKKIRLGATIQIPQSIALRSDAPPRPKVLPTARKEEPTEPPQATSYENDPQDTFSSGNAEVAAVTQPAPEMPLPPTDLETNQVAPSADERSESIALDNAASTLESDRASPTMPIESDPVVSQEQLPPTYSEDSAAALEVMGNEGTQEPSSPQDAGLMKGILEAVGNAALDAKKAPAGN